jgi:hypothetical protein
MQLSERFPTANMSRSLPTSTLAAQAHRAEGQCNNNNNNNHHHHRFCKITQIITVARDCRILYGFDINYVEL